MAELTIKLHEVMSSEHSEVYRLTLYPKSNVTGEGLYELIAGLFQYQIPITSEGKKTQIEALSRPEIISKIESNTKCEVSFAVVRRSTPTLAPPSNGDLAQCRQRLRGVDAQLTSIDVELADIEPFTLSRLEKIQTIKQQIKDYVDLTQEVSTILNSCPRLLVKSISLNAAKDELKPAIENVCKKISGFETQVAQLDKENKRLKGEINNLKEELNISITELAACRERAKQAEFDSIPKDTSPEDEDGKRPLDTNGGNRPAI